MTVETIARALGGCRAGHRWTARCPVPAHEDENPSLSITDAEDSKVLVHCFGGCSQEAVIDALRARGLWPEASNPRGFHNPIGDSRRTPPPNAPPAQDRSDQSAFGLRLWEAAKPAAGTPVEDYLQARGITLPVPDAIRFAPNLRHRSGSTWPGMVARVTPGTDGEPPAIQRTFLKPDGSGQAPIDPQKMTLGPCRSGAVRLATATGTLMVGEGIETCLSAMQATGLPAWAALGANQISALVIPETTTKIIILADKDPAGISAALNSAFQWETGGKEVRIAVPPVGNDFNGTLQVEGGQDKIKQAVQESSDYQTFFIEAAESGRVDILSSTTMEFLARVSHENIREYEDFVQRVKNSPNIKVSITELRKEVSKKRAQHKRNDKDREKKEGAGADNDIMAFVEQKLDSFYTPEGVAYAGIETETGTQYHRIGSEHLEHLIVLKYKDFSGKLLHTNQIKDLIRYTKSHAIEADKENVYQHIGFKDGNIYVCLGHDPFNVIEINAAGWTVIEHAPPVRFEWTEAPALPMPERGGTLEDLRHILNVKDEDDLELIWSWLFSLFLRDGGYPILILTGEQGTAKTTAAKLLGRLVHGDELSPATLPEKESDLWALVKNEPILIFDNISNITPAISDHLCGISTGSTRLSRRLYSDADVHTVKGKRPMILTGITNMVRKGDLADRAFFVELSKIPEDKRLTERELNEKFEKEWPKLLGALFNMVVAGLKTYPHARHTQLPRMADAVSWTLSCYGFKTDKDAEGHPFLSALEKSVNVGTDETLEAQPILEFLQESIENNSFGCPWEGSAQEFLKELKDLHYHQDGENVVKGLPPGWPSNASWVSRRLKEAAPALRRKGVEVKSKRIHEKRILKIEYTSPEEKYRNTKYGTSS